MRKDRDYRSMNKTDLIAVCSEKDAEIERLMEENKRLRAEIEKPSKRNSRNAGRKVNIADRERKMVAVRRSLYEGGTVTNNAQKLGMSRQTYYKYIHILLDEGYICQQDLYLVFPDASKIKSERAALRFQRDINRQLKEHKEARREAYEKYIELETRVRRRSDGG